MAKLTFDEVAQKAEQLVEQNLKATVKTVQAALGGRSTDDVGKLLKQWHETKAASAQKIFLMPDTVAAVIHLEMERRTVEVETRANVRIAQVSEKTDELLDELKELHQDERNDWARERVQLQTDAELGRRNSSETMQLRAQVRQLELDLQSRTVQLDVSIQKINGLEVAAASMQKLYEQTRTAEVNAEVQRKLLEELKDLHRIDKGTWAEERSELRKDAEAGRRDSAEKFQLREQMVKLEAQVLSASARYDKLFAQQEGLQLMADSAQEVEERARDAEAAVKAMQKERDHFKVLATTNAQMVAPFLDHMEAGGEGPMIAMAGQTAMQAVFKEASQLRSADS